MLAVEDSICDWRFLQISIRGLNNTGAIELSNIENPLLRAKHLRQQTKNQDRQDNHSHYSALDRREVNAFSHLHPASEAVKKVLMIFHPGRGEMFIA